MLVPSASAYTWITVGHDLAHLGHVIGHWACQRGSQCLLSTPERRLKARQHPTQNGH